MSNIYKDLKCICLIIGPNRSGSSLVRSILDAHPEIMIAQEYGRSGIYEKIKNDQISKNKVIEEFYYNALNKKPTSQKLIFNENTGKIKHSIYDHTIPGSSQGKCKSLKVIGDKSGPWISEQVNKNTDFVEKLDSFFNIPIKYINMVRNPLDNIMSMRMAHQDYKKYFYWCDGSVIISKKVKKENYMDLHLEELINAPINNLVKMHKFLGFSIDQSHIEKCRSIIFEKPHHSRKSEYNFSEQDLNVINSKIKKYPFLLRYGDVK